MAGVIDIHSEKKDCSEPYTRDIVILANSIKHRGRCIAGKDIKTKEWVRLVTNDGSTSFNNPHLSTLCGNASNPKLLDIMRISFSHKSPSKFHPEDEHIDGSSWVKIGESKIDELDKLVNDEAKDWVDDTSKINGKTERIPQVYFDTHQLEQSLQVIKLTKENNVLLKYEHKISATGRGYYRPRLDFIYKNKEYSLPVTYPGYGLKEDKPIDRQISKIYVTIGLGEMYKDGGNDHFKLVVGAIEVNDDEQ